MMELHVNGHRCYAYTGGKALDPTLPCVVFVHGALHDHSVWTLLARWCAHHGHGVLALDQPGHGRSEGPLLDSVQGLGSWVLAVLNTVAIPINQVRLVGHSMGSLIALEAAAQATDSPARLVMLGTGYPMKVSPALLNAARDTPAVGMDMVNQFSFSTTAAKPSFPGPGNWLHGSNRQLMGRMQAQGADHGNLFLHDFSLCNAYDGAWHAAERVVCPVDLVVGEADQMTPPHATAELAQRLRATVHRVPGGHAMMQEQPDAVLQALRQALT